MQQTWNITTKVDKSRLPKRVVTTVKQLQNHARDAEQHFVGYKCLYLYNAAESLQVCGLGKYPENNLQLYWGAF